MAQSPRKVTQLAVTSRFDPLSWGILEGTKIRCSPNTEVFLGGRGV